MADAWTVYRSQGDWANIRRAERVVRLAVAKDGRGGKRLTDSKQARLNRLTSWKIVRLLGHCAIAAEARACS